VRDLATFENPNQLSQGMGYVLVNGVPVIDQGKMTGAKPGKVLRGPGYVRYYFWMIVSSCRPTVAVSTRAGKSEPRIQTEVRIFRLNKLLDENLQD